MSEWKIVSEPPPNAKYVLLYSPVGDDDSERYGVGFYNSFEPYGKEMGEPGRWSHDLDGEPTHWQPLPEPPK